MAQYDVVIKSGTVAGPHGVFRGHVAVRDGRIAALLFEHDSVPSTEEVIDASGKLVLPGAVDTHVHFREPGLTDSEDFTTGTMGAAAGGVTTIVEQASTIPPVTDGSIYREKLEIVGPRAVVDYALWGGIVPGNHDGVRRQAEAGVRYFKAYMSHGPRHMPPPDDGDLLAAMEFIARQDGLIGIHAVNEAIRRHAEQKMKAEDRHDQASFAGTGSPIAEYEATQRALTLAAHAGVRTAILHVSLPEAAQLVKEAKARRQKVVLETIPSFLLLDESLYQRKGAYIKLGPPCLRDRASVEKLWDYLYDGTIDYLSSDHAPVPLSVDERGSPDIWLAGSGLPGVQFTLPLMLSEAVHKRNLPLDRLVQLTSTNAARAFGLYPRKSSLLPGSDADLAILDPEREWVVTPESFFTKWKVSPIIGSTIKGWVERTLVRGQTVYREGDFPLGAGYGQHLGEVH
ncbi:MAG: amidohydrolase family protein [Chloroflexi bacterium]|nr:amidohydrolase family protein [Chloroflexota bacterium]